MKRRTFLKATAASTQALRYWVPPRSPMPKGGLSKLFPFPICRGSIQLSRPRSQLATMATKCTTHCSASMRTSDARSAAASWEIWTMIETSIPVTRSAREKG